MTPALPPIASAQLRKRVFTHVSVFRLPLDQLEQIENADNDRLAFLGRAAIDYALSGSSTPVHDVDAQLSSLARSYDIIQFLHTAWLEPDPTPQATETQLMEAYVGALVVENEDKGMIFAQQLVAAMGGQIPSEPVQVTTATPRTKTGTETTGQLHDLAARHGITLSWTDRAEGPKHAQQWTSDVTLQDKTTNRTWACIPSGACRSKKLARADAASKVLSIWNDIISKHPDQ